MFQGSAHVGKAEHFSFVEAVGGSMNGTTFYDRTNFYETVPSGQLPFILWLEADRMGTLLDALSVENLDNQRAVVQNERRSSIDNQPYGVLFERLMASLFPDPHPYNHPPIGSMVDLDRASTQEVSAFFRRWYAPNNAVMSIVGDVEPDEALRLVEHYFGGIEPNPRIGRLRVPRLEPGGLGAREVIIDAVPLFRLVVGFRTPPLGDPDCDAIFVATAILGGGALSRLARRLAREDPLTTTPTAETYPLAGGGFMVVDAMVLPEIDPQAVERAMLDEIDGLAREVIDDDELARAKAMLTSARLADIGAVSELADRLSMYASILDDPGAVLGEIDRIEAVSADDVRRVAGRYLSPDDRVILLFAPRDAESDEEER
jgi:predicted Zn-dependent peptidase